MSRMASSTHPSRHREGETVTASAETELPPEIREAILKAGVLGLEHGRRELDDAAEAVDSLRRVAVTRSIRPAPSSSSEGASSCD